MRHLAGWILLLGVIAGISAALNAMLSAGGAIAALIPWALVAMVGLALVVGRGTKRFVGAAAQYHVIVKAYPILLRGAPQVDAWRSDTAIAYTRAISRTSPEYSASGPVTAVMRTFSGVPQ